MLPHRIQVAPRPPGLRSGGRHPCQSTPNSPTCSFVSDEKDEGRQPRRVVMEAVRLSWPMKELPRMDRCVYAYLDRVEEQGSYSGEPQAIHSASIARSSGLGPPAGGIDSLSVAARLHTSASQSMYLL